MVLVNMCRLGYHHTTTAPHPRSIIFVVRAKIPRLNKIQTLIQAAQNNRAMRRKWSKKEEAAQRRL